MSKLVSKLRFADDKSDKSKEKDVKDKKKEGDTTPTGVLSPRAEKDTKDKEKEKEKEKDGGGGLAGLFSPRQRGSVSKRKQLGRAMTFKSPREGQGGPPPSEELDIQFEKFLVRLLPVLSCGAIST